jgi:hypothetical protein
MVRLGVLALIVAAVIAFLLTRRGGALFTIRVRDGRAALDGAIPGRSQVEVLDFIEKLDLPDGAVVRGHPGGRGFRLALNRKVPERHRQRIRNFLYL